MKIKKDDQVMVIAGKDKGKTGQVMRAMPSTNQVVVEGVNVKKRHVKSRGENEGGIVEFAAPVDVSNVAIIDPKDKKPTRVGYKVEKDKKVRIAKRSGTVLK